MSKQLEGRELDATVALKAKLMVRMKIKKNRKYTDTAIYHLVGNVVTVMREFDKPIPECEQVVDEKRVWWYVKDTLWATSRLPLYHSSLDACLRDLMPRMGDKFMLERIDEGVWLCTVGDIYRDGTISASADNPATAICQTFLKMVKLKEKE